MKGIEKRLVLTSVSLPVVQYKWKQMPEGIYRNMAQRVLTRSCNFEQRKMQATACTEVVQN